MTKINNIAKRSLCLLIAALVISVCILQPSIQTYAATKTDIIKNVFFTDLTDPSEYLYAPVYWAASEDIIRGYGDGTFRGNEPCAREEFVLMLWRFAGRPDSKMDLGYEDVYANRPSYTAIRWATENGIIKGFSDNTFKPLKYVTREEAAIMLWRYYNKQTAESQVSFTDVSSDMASYAAIKWGVENDIIKGYKEDNTFRGSDWCLRKHIAIFLYRCHEQFPEI